MLFKKSDKFSSEDGDYCILNDYGSEGLSVWAQYETLKEALDGIDTSIGCPQTIVKLVHFDIKEIES